MSERLEIKNNIDIIFLPVVLSPLKKEQRQNFIYAVEWNRGGHCIFGKKFGKSVKNLNIPLVDPEIPLHIKMYLYVKVNCKITFNSLQVEAIL